MKTFFGSLVAIGALAALAAPAHALSLNVQYFTVSESDPDFGTNPVGTYYLNEVQSKLGPNGLPVYNSGYGGYPLKDVNSSGELTWWSPAFNNKVTATAPGTVTLTQTGSVYSYSNSSLYPPSGTGQNDANGYQTAIFSGKLSVNTAESVTIDFGADDDAFLAVNGVVIAQEGGIHTISPAPVTTGVLLPGQVYNLQLFYADRQQSQAQLYFDVATSGVTITPSTVPLPASAPMFGAALLALGAVGYGAKRKKAAVAR